MDCCSWRLASGSVLPMKMEILQRRFPAPVDHHLHPFITYSSPSRSMRLWMLVASDDATSGSVMQKHDRISPSSNGFSHRSCCSGEPYRTRTSMFPVSGALQLKTSGAMRLRPMISHSGAYSRLERPAPYSESGKNMFQSPADLAFSFNSSMIGGVLQRSPPVSTCSWCVFSLG